MAETPLNKQLPETDSRKGLTGPPLQRVPPASSDTSSSSTGSTGQTGASNSEGAKDGKP